MRTKTIAVLSIALVAALVLTGVGSATSHGTKSVTAGLSTDAGVARYLTSIGIDPKGVVIQRGARNYAGMKCPGAKWNCTTARRVFQVSSTGGANVFACVAPGGSANGSDANSASISCLTVQASTSASNTATCTELSVVSATPATLTQTCDITQTSDTGANDATVTQSAQQGPLCGLTPPATTSQQTQSVSQIASVVQSSPAGPATALINQDARQCAATSTTGVATQAQTTSQDFTVRQGPVGFDPAHPAGCGSKAGTLDATATQTQDQRGFAPTAGTGSSETQNADLIGHMDQCSGDVAHWTANQNENQFLAKNSIVQQSQYGPTSLTGKAAVHRGRTLQRGYCCSFQGVNSLSTCTITQKTEQTGNANALQIEDLTTHAGSSGSCQGAISSTQNATTNASSATTTPGGTLNQTQQCTSGTCTVPTALAWSGATAGAYHGLATLGASLTRTDAIGGGVPNQAVSLGVGSNTCVPDPTTNTAGVATCDVRLTDQPGSYAGSASFAGNTPFLASSASLPSFTVTKHPTTLLYTGPPSGDFHDTVTVSAQLLESNPGPAVDVGKSVLFVLGSQSCSGPTLADGSVSCQLTIADLPGSTTVSVSFAGDAFYLAAPTITPPFTIGHEEAVVTYSGSTKADYTDPETFRATLTEDGTVPLQGQQISFQIASGPLDLVTSDKCTATTNASGVASCSISIVAHAPGSYTVIASFAGDAAYLPATTALAFTVTPEETGISYTGPTSAKKKTTVTLSAKLSSDDGQPLSSRSLTFSLGTQSCSPVPTTGASGVASCKITLNQNPGTVTLKVSFAGDSFYNPSTTSKAFTIKP